MIILAEESHKGDGTMFEMLNIRDSVVYRIEASGWDLI